MKIDSNEIDEGEKYIGYREALDIIASNVRLLDVEELSLGLCTGRIAAIDMAALVSYPSIDVSLKDGFAVKSTDVAYAVRDNPVCLKVAGSAFAGNKFDGEVKDGCAVKVCSGSEIPVGADAVVSGEFCGEVSRGEVIIKADAGPGRNILRTGSEVKAGTTILKKGEKLLPGKLGLAAAAGISLISVHRRPRVGIISIGDEVVTPGSKLNAGQLYASNMVTMQAWLASFNISCVTSIVSDDKDNIMIELNKHLADVEVILTSGGAWGSERDLVIGVLEKLGWQELFHYVRMGPGKGIAFGFLGNIPIFCLPGGPTSNEMAFLQMALPAILSMSGESSHPLQIISARLTEDVPGRHKAWTEFKDAVVTFDEEVNYSVSPYKNKSRLQSIASANALICIPEGREFLSKGEVIPVQLLKMRLDNL